MFRSILPKLLAFTVLPFSLFSIQRFATFPMGTTTIWWAVEFIVVLVLIWSRYIYFDRINQRNFKILNWYMYWVIFCILRGFFMAENYWDFKSLIGNTFALLVPLIAFTATRNERLQSIFSFYVKVGLPLSLLILPFFGIGVWGWYLFPVSFFMLFFPLVKFNWRVIIFAISLVAMLGDITVRSHVFKYGIPILLMGVYYLKSLFVIDKLFEVARKIFIILPWFFFVLAVAGIFNVFKIDEYIKSNKLEYKGDTEKEGYQQSLNSDSRTFIYEEVLESAIKYEYWVLGRTPARGNETIFFADFFEEISGKAERYKNEANVPNVFTWMGIVGLFLYFLIFYKASYLAINRSNNFFSKIIGLFVAFRWMYSWVEDYYSFGMNEFIIWVMIGICLSESFRNMSDSEVKLWIRGIFDKKYNMAYQKYMLSKNSLYE